MGHGTSSLTKDQKEEIARKMKTVIETCNSNNLDSDVAQAKILKEYRLAIEKINESTAVQLQSKSLDDHQTSEKLVGSVKKVVAVTRFEPPQVKARRPSLGGFGGYQGTGQSQKKKTRRRSFDANANAGANKKNVEALVSSIKANMEKAVELIGDGAKVNAATTTAAASTMEPSESTADNWDSVTQQPFCTVCQMAFKSIGFLERHQKYSDLHLKNVKKKEVATTLASVSKEEAEVAAAAEAAKEKAAADAEAAKERQRLSLLQEEGKEYKLFYNGSKFYWRTQKTVDIDMYLHNLPQIIEVIAFDPDKHREVSRLYLRYTVIAETLEAVIASDIEMKRLELSQDRFHSKMSPEDELEQRDTITKNRVITYILQRLQLDTMNDMGTIMFIPLAGDATTQNPLVKDPPSVLLPVYMTRRRRTNAEEIQKTINSISTDQLIIKASAQRANSLSDNKALLEAARKKAQRIATYVHEGARFLQQKKWYSDFNLPKKRFIRAVYFVMRRTEVAKVRALLMDKYPTLANSAKYKEQLAKQNALK